MRFTKLLAASLIALAAMMLVCGGCDEDPGSPGAPDGGYGLLRPGTIFDFDRGTEAERDSLPYDLAMYLNSGVSCDGDSCEVFLTVTLSTPPGGKIIDLGVTSMSAVERLPDAGYVTSLIWSDGGLFPFDAVDAAGEGISAECRNHTFAVVDPDGSRYLMTVLDAPVWPTGYYWRWDACLEFVWRRVL